MILIKVLNVEWLFLSQLVDAKDRLQESNFTEANNIYISRQRKRIGDVCGCDRLK